MSKYSTVYTTYMIKYVMIGIIAIVMISVSNAQAVTNSTNNVGVPLSNQIKKLIENPFFAPDGSCLFDAYQLHCIPGDHQDCSDIQGFAQNEDGTCWPETMVNGTWKHVCPPGYHSESEDESGQCYPDNEPCYPGQIRDPDKATCDYEGDICAEYNLTGCYIDGIFISDYPDEYCLTNPAQDNCAAILINGTSIGQCPEGFSTVRIENFTTPSRCLPENVEEVEIAERERQVNDPNRCAKGYELYVAEHIDIFRTGGPIGTCNKIS
jgi:hypothetical protein